MSNVPNWHDLLENANLTSARANSLIWGSEHSFMDDDDRSTTTSRQISVVSFPPSRLSSVSVPGSAGRPSLLHAPDTVCRRMDNTTPAVILQQPNGSPGAEKPDPKIVDRLHIFHRDQETQAGNHQPCVEPEKQGMEAAADASTPANNKHSKPTASTPQRRSSKAQGTESNGQPTTRRRSEFQHRIREVTSPSADGSGTAEDAESSDEGNLIGDDNTSDGDPDYGAEPKKGRKTGAGRRTSSHKSSGRKK
ncbi:hypothetical protein H2199_003702 [Coniosporium tulheliwenetii]|uniref:Uncharacterized protein n=1 Tax=Coniosporium tulheliwenetii TaxID=3383036 RepID=A0ACC2ZAL9_9PEZI|nr:hypothetical protein H2199_003702 [Cladosporium sp. JES 115]